MSDRMISWLYLIAGFCTGLLLNVAVHIYYDKIKEIWNNLKRVISRE